MSQPYTKHGSASSAQAPQSTRSARLRLLLAAVLACARIVFLSYRLLTPPRPERLRLDADVPLAPPPPLPAEDKAALREGLLRLQNRLAIARAQPNDPTVRFAIGYEALRAGDLLTAREELRAGLQLRPETDSAIYDALGRCEIQLGLFKEAQDTYQKLLARAPGQAAGYIGLRRAQGLLGQREAATQTLERGARAVAPTDISGRLGIAGEFEMRDELPRALAEAQAARARAPDSAAATLTAAHLLFRLGRLSEARTLLEQMLAAHPDDPLVRRYLATVLDNPLLPQRDPALAEHYLLETLQRNHDDVEACQQLAQFYQDARRYRQAAYMFTWLLALVPDSASARLQLAQAYAHLGNPGLSAEQRTIALRLLARNKEEARLRERHDHRPTDPQARLALARHYLDAGQFAKALVELQSAYCLAPRSPQVRRQLTNFYAQLGVPLPPSLQRGERS